ncbi:MAG: hypothetical protein ACQEVA_08800, partial [Myxococcota bacterium]
MRQHLAKIWLFPALALVLAFLATPVSAQEEHGKRSEGEVSKMTQEVSQEIYSPYCPGKTLAM